MTYTLELEIAQLPITINQIGKASIWHTQAERKKWRNLIYKAAIWNRPQYPIKNAKATLTRHSSRQPDYDGLVISFKHVVDSLIFNKIIEDDSPSCFKAEYLWERAKPKQGKISIRIEEVLSDEQVPRTS